MLNPENDRLDYGQILAAPAGYKMDFAVGTTYSLDLDALVGACIALGLSEETDSELMKNPICLLEALRNTGDKVALFCEGGQIHLPNKVTSLYILLEKMVYQVNAVKRRDVKGFPSFHPKFWLIRYVNERGEVLYRTVILSRNLTFDRSWDVTFYMDGKKTENVSKKNEPVQDFLSFLMKNLGDDENSRMKAKVVRTMIRELPQVAFVPGSREFYDYDFLPTGIKKSSGGFYSITDTQLFRNFLKRDGIDGLHEIFIMSPFVSSDVIRYFNERSRYMEHAEYMLITRAMSLGRLKPADCSHFKIFTMKDAVLQGETAISESGAVTSEGKTTILKSGTVISEDGATALEGGQEAAAVREDSILKQDIHAKVYLTRKGSDTDLYLGSLNASHNAVFGNVEFMICLHSKNRYLNMEKLTAGIFCGGEGGPDNPFQQVSLSDSAIDEEDEKKHLLDGIIKKINRLHPHAVISAQEDFYDITLDFDEPGENFDGFVINISPLLANKPMAWGRQVLFSSLALTDLSEFYKITVSDGERTVERVLKVPTEGMPEDREKAVVSAVVNDKACFYRYIAFLLGDSFVLSALENDAQGRTGNSNHLSGTAGLPALYEKMLKTTATAPERFKEIDYLIQAVSKDGVVPEYFEELYNTFRKAVKL